MSKRKPYLFICHASADDSRASVIADALEDAGIEVWLDHFVLRPGDDWSKLIDRAAKNTNYCLLLLSHASMKSAYCEAEWNSFLARDNTSKLYVAPIEHVDKEAIHIRLGTIQPFDLWSNFETQLQELIKVIQIDLLGASGKSLRKKPRGSPSLHVENGNLEITVEHPLLVGVLVDVSRSMLELLEGLPKQKGITRRSIDQAIKIFVEKAISLCKTPEVEQVLPRLAFFLYGYGFGNLRANIRKALLRLGMTFEKQSWATSEPTSSNIRDLLAEASHAKKLPITPNTAILNENWDAYRTSIEAQIADTGLGASLLGEAVKEVNQRFQAEMLNGYFRFPILLIISDGQMQHTSEKELDSLIRELQQNNIQIICCYIGSKTITAYKQLYAVEQPNWTIDASRLFRCSSIISNDNPITKTILRVASEYGWSVPDGARAFFQANNADVIEEVVTFLVSPLQTR